MASPGDLARNHPPPLDEEQLIQLVSQIKDWQLNHGSLLKLVQMETEHSFRSLPVGVSCFPTIFPRSRFQQAQDIQTIYNKLYCAISEDEEWLFNAIKDLLHVEPLAAVLWGIYEAAKNAGFVQDISAGLFRSDYMLHASTKNSARYVGSIPDTTLKQVEFNSFSCAGATHANKVADMHRYLTHIGAYNGHETKFDISAIPANKNIESLATLLASAHNAYGKPKCKLAEETAVLFIVQPNNFNIADERPIEYALWNRETPVPAYRLDFGPDVLEYTKLSETRELLFQPPWLASTSPVEISVIYMRAGYEAREYDQVGRDARLLLETSAAIKCPSILGHLTTFKKVQQALTAKGALEDFLTDAEAATIRETFVSIYPLDHSDEGRFAREQARNPNTVLNYILKPSLEGGGHNIYGDDIPGFLESVPESNWSSYVLMERIQPPLLANLLMGPAGIESGEVVSELGILGTCLWKRKSPRGGCDMLHNSVGGWTFKTKHADIDEMSVVKGYGCFDTPYLLDI